MGQIRQSAPEWCFFRQAEPAAYYRGLAAIGIGAVEMAPPEHIPFARAAGLQVINAAGPGMTEGLNRTANHAKLTAAIEQTIRVAAAQQIPDVIVFSGNRGGQPDAEGLANCISALKPLARFAAAHHVGLLFEMLCTQDHADYQASHSAYGFRVVQEVGAPNLRALYDIYHMHRMGEDVVRDITAHVDLIGHLHVAQSPRRSITSEPGEIDYAPIVRGALAAGYTGWWGQEFVPTADPLSQLAEAVRALEALAGSAAGAAR